MKRKLVSQGNGALTLVLPHKWIQKNSLSKGNYLSIIETGKDLVVAPEYTQNNQELEIQVSQNAPFFKRYLRSSYILGIDKVIISSSSILPINDISLQLSSLIGFEIIEQSSKKIVISMIVAQAREEEVDHLLKRVFFMLSSMFDDIISSSSSNTQNSSLIEISKIEESVNRLVNFCLRMLNKKGYTDFKKTPYIYSIVFLLEQIADHLRDLCLSSPIMPKEVIYVVNELKSYYLQIFELFYEYDMAKIAKTKEKREKNISLCISLVQTHSLQAIYLYAIANALHQMEIALDPINSNR